MGCHCQIQCRFEDLPNVPNLNILPCRLAVGANRGVNQCDATELLRASPLQSNNSPQIGQRSSKPRVQPLGGRVHHGHAVQQFI